MKRTQMFHKNVFYTLETASVKESEIPMHPETLSTNPIHLGIGATAQIEPQFTGAMEWYEAYSERHTEDGVEGRLVSMHTFHSSWDTWEMHPLGSEVVLCTQGVLTLQQESAGGLVTTVTLEAGQYAINPPGIWHTADVVDPASAVFITAGMGTEIRPR